MPIAVVKLFYEEPFQVEAVVPDLDADARPRARLDRTPTGLDDLLAAPRAYRAYLAGTLLDGGRSASVGLTALPDARTWAPPLVEALGADGWQAVAAIGLRPVAPVELAQTLDAGTWDALAQHAAPEHAARLAAAAGPDRRRALPDIQALLDAGVTLVLPEPAHDGRDLSLFAPTPLRERVEAAWRGNPHPDARRFSAPFQRMRSEHKFYFEAWALDEPPAGVAEIA